MPNFDTGNYIVSTNESGILYVDQTASWGTATTGVQTSMRHRTGIAPELYFKYIKKKFGILEEMKLKSRLKKLEKAFYAAVENGQEALGNKIMTDMARETRESVLYAKGIRHFIEKADIDQHKRNIRDGHISDTKFGDFTRVIPKDVLEKKKKVEQFFDGFVIYHYWNEKAEKNRTTKQKMTAYERARMRDPVLFGVIRESNRLYFVADWEDEFCDLTFEEMIDVIGKDEEEHTISRNPKLNA